MLSARSLLEFVKQNVVAGKLVGLLPENVFALKLHHLFVVRKRKREIAFVLRFDVDVVEAVKKRAVFDVFVHRHLFKLLLGKHCGFYFVLKNVRQLVAVSV